MLDPKIQKMIKDNPYYSIYIAVTLLIVYACYISCLQLQDSENQLVNDAKKLSIGTMICTTFAIPCAYVLMTREVSELVYFILMCTILIALILTFMQSTRLVTVDESDAKQDISTQKSLSIATFILTLLPTLYYFEIHIYLYFIGKIIFDWIFGPRF